MSLSPTPRFAFLAAVVLCSTACEGDPGVHSIDPARTIEPVGRDIAWNATPAQRFGFDRGAPQAAAVPHLHWDTPAGWQDLPPSQMREADFRVAGDPDASCYLTTLTGEGGGLAANVNRWRQQIGLDALSSEEIAALPRVPFLGVDAVRVDFEGTWAGMDAERADDGFRLIGLLAVAPERSRFLKLVGPGDLVAAELGAFERLAASFREDATVHGPAGASGAPAAGSVVPPPRDSNNLAWEAPDGWTQGPPRTMRAVSFSVGSDAESGTGECYVVVLAGDGGGLAGNINRWRAQMGEGDLSSAEIDALEEVPMFGGSGHLVAIAGHYTGMGDDDVPEASLLGAVRLLGDRSIFVKMIGPTPVVESEREAFVAFCGSLRDGE